MSDGLRELRAIVVQFQQGTRVLNGTRDERVSVAAIQGTLAVMIAEIDKLLPPVPGAVSMPTAVDPQAEVPGTRDTREKNS